MTVTIYSFECFRIDSDNRRCAIATWFSIPSRALTSISHLSGDKWHHVHLHLQPEPI